MTDPTITDADHKLAQSIISGVHGFDVTINHNHSAAQAIAAHRHAHTAPLEARVQELEHIAKDLLQHVDWLTSGLPDMLERAALTDEEGLIGAATDAAESARKALEGRGS